jgi:3',5'-cyclic AMP phosphodiesterase CpdA
VIVAQISDLHVRRAGHVLHYMANTADYLERTIERINTLKTQPDVVLLTGDLVESGSPHEYRRLRTILKALNAPHFLIPGNHDDRPAMRRAFSEHRYLRTFPNHASFAIDVWPLRILALDSTDPDHVGGFVDDERLAWLDEELRSHRDRPTLIAMHHPPFRTGIATFDSHGFERVDELEALIAGHPQVARLISGHIHTALTKRWGGTIACSAPSTSPQFVIGRSALGIGIEAAGFLMHEWRFGAEFRSYVVRPHARNNSDKIA